MQLLQYLIRTCRLELLSIAVLGILGGLSAAGLIAVVSSALHNGGRREIFLFLFLLTVVVKISCNIGSSILLVRLSQNSILRLIEELCYRVLDAPFRRLEEVGASRILASLTDDISVLASAIQAIPPLALNVAVLIGCAAYLTWLSWIAAVAMLAFVVFGALCYKVLLGRAYRAIRLAQQGRDILFANFRALTEGIKELKLSRQRREAFLAEDVGPALDFVRRQNVIAMSQYALADGWSQASFYLLMGTMLFGLPALFSIRVETLTAYVFTGLYAAAPVFSIIAALPTFNRGHAALERLETLGVSLNVIPTENSEQPLSDVAHPEIEFRGVDFSYDKREDGSEFTLGPLDLRLEPGELVFVIGGNGSGKSTFVKLLTGLYPRRSGEILVAGKAVAATSQEAYRELFSAVYSDFFLFERLLGHKGAELEDRANAYLNALELSNKVRIEGTKFSTTALSQGQRRRLALLAAYLEDRPICVLDEWAADQDPAYRRVFYTKLLPELKRRGKTIVVVTHDDRYFYLGDKILKLDYGHLVDQDSSGLSREESMADAPVGAPSVTFS